MRLLLFHPVMTSIPCSDCQRFMYDLETGERLKICNGSIDVARPALTPPPCETCPKQSPRHEAEHVLSRRNLRTLRLYHEVRATGGTCLTEHERRDRVLIRNLSIVDRIYREHDRKSQSDDLSNLLLSMVAR